MRYERMTTSELQDLLDRKEEQLSQCAPEDYERIEDEINAIEDELDSRDCDFDDDDDW